MLIGIHDYDVKKGKLFIPNLQAMKISSYYKNNGHIVNLLPREKLRETYDELYFFRNKINKHKHLDLWEKENSFCFGRQFSQRYVPLSEEIEESKPDITLYSPYFRQAFLDLTMTEASIASYLKSIDYIQIYTFNTVFNFEYHIPKPRCFLYDEYWPDIGEVSEAIDQISKMYSTIKVLRNILLDSEEQYWTIPHNSFSFHSHFCFVMPTTKTYSEYKNLITECQEKNIRKMPMIYWGIDEQDNYSELFMAKELIATINKGFLAYSKNMLPKFKYQKNSVKNFYNSCFTRVDSYFNHNNLGKSIFDFFRSEQQRQIVPLMEIPIYGPTIRKLIHYKLQKNQGGWHYNGC